MYLIKKNIFFPLSDYLTGTRTIHYLKIIKRMSNFSKSEIINWQNDKLKLLINHSYHNTEYYKKLFDDNRILPSEINSISDLKKYLH